VPKPFVLWREGLACRCHLPPSRAMQALSQQSVAAVRPARACPIAQRVCAARLRGAARVSRAGCTLYALGSAAAARGAARMAPASRRRLTRCRLPPSRALDMRRAVRPPRGGRHRPAGCAWRPHARVALHAGAPAPRRAAGGAAPPPARDTAAPAWLACSFFDGVDLMCRLRADAADAARVRADPRGRHQGRGEGGDGGAHQHAGARPLRAFVQHNPQAFLVAHTHHLRAAPRLRRRTAAALH
jgi:hypothetical protein